MTVDDLIARLAELPGDTPVILAQDREGTAYAPLSRADTALYLAEDSWEGERYESSDPDTPAGAGARAISLAGELSYAPDATRPDPAMPCAGPQRSARMTNMKRNERPKLPDVYEVRQGHAMAEAFRQGDADRVEQLRRNTVAESATDLGEEAVLDEVSRAALLFRRATDASDRGDHKQADALMTQLKENFSQATLDMILSAAHLHVGMEQGWLPADDHDRLTRWADAIDLGPDVRALINMIERRAS
jgi:hypothetical protein